MGFVNKYPYVDFHELNADTLIAKVDDASAEAKAAAETVATYNDRLTTVEGDLAPIKAAMPGISSDVSDLQHDVGIMDSLITNTINPAVDTLKNEVETPTTGLLDKMTAAEGSISTLQNEVETPTTGLLDRVTALENQPSTGGVTEYLRFGTGGSPINWDPRITYTYLDGLIAMQASADKLTNIILVEDDEMGTTWYYTLNEGRYQISAGTPRGGFAFTCRKPVLDGNNVVIGYNVCTVDVDKNAATPTYSEVYEAVLPTVTSADAGNVLTVDGNGGWYANTPGSSSTRTPLTVSTQLGGLSLVSNNSYYTDEDTVIDILVTTTVARNNDAIIKVEGSNNLAYTQSQPISIDEIDTSSYAPIVGAGGRITYNSSTNLFVYATCSDAGMLRIYGVFKRA